MTACVFTAAVFARDAISSRLPHAGIVDCLYRYDPVVWRRVAWMSSDAIRGELSRLALSDVPAPSAFVAEECL